MNCSAGGHAPQGQATPLGGAGDMSMEERQPEPGDRLISRQNGLGAGPWFKQGLRLCVVPAHTCQTPSCVSGICITSLLPSSHWETKKEVMGPEEARTLPLTVSPWRRVILSEETLEKTKI